MKPKMLGQFIAGLALAALVAPIISTSAEAAGAGKGFKKCWDGSVVPGQTGKCPPKTKKGK